MAFTRKQQIRGIRILLTVFYGFLLSSILFRYIIHGTVETIRRPTNPYAITMIVLGGLILISIILAIYATWYEKAIILLISSIVLIFVFILTLVFGILRIINTAPQRRITATTIAPTAMNVDDSLVVNPLSSNDKNENITDIYALAEDVTKLITELVAILFAILATLVLYRYIKAKYANPPAKTEPKGTYTAVPTAVPTAGPKAT